MKTDHQLVQFVYLAKNDSQKADDLIEKYIPFIRAEATKFMNRLCTDQDDEYSISMMGFYEAIMGYEKSRGAFLNYAAMLIRSRLIDYSRKEQRHQGNVSLHAESSNDSNLLLVDSLADNRDHFEELAHREATKQEISELSAVMAAFGVSFSDIAENSPKQDRTRNVCRETILYAKENPHLLDELLKTKKLPLSQLVKGAGIERKTLERHRKYILAMLLILTNGYEIIRGHLHHVLKKGVGAV